MKSMMVSGLRMHATRCRLDKLCVHVIEHVIEIRNHKAEVCGLHMLGGLLCVAR